MFCTKTSVDRHVQEIFRKVRDDNERSLRCYNIAKLYYQVADYESARRYIYSYLEVKPDTPGAHKLLGQILEALGQKEQALVQYKESLELDGRQDDLVIRICELLADNETSIDVKRIKYWIERAGDKFANHQAIFQLKEKVVIHQAGASNDGFEALITSEIAVRPLDVDLRVKLIKYYTAQGRLEDAYKHAISVEVSEHYRNNIVWYEALCEFLAKYKEGKDLKWPFWVLYISSLERFAALALQEYGNPAMKTVQEASQAVLNFDQALTEARRQSFTNLKLVEEMFEHMWGQLQYHLACLLLRKTKRGQKNWAECGCICTALMLGAINSPPIDSSLPWATSLKELSRAQVALWAKEGAYRCSQSGHVLQDYAVNPRKLLTKVEEFCNGAWREQVYKKIFTDNVHEKFISTSYFANRILANPPMRLLSAAQLKSYDQSAKNVWPGSLHHHVWLGVANRPRQRSNSDELPLFPNESSHVFRNLQLSVYNLKQATPESIGLLDVDAFLNIAVLCALTNVSEQQRSGYLSPDRMTTLPADLTFPLCTTVQETWWNLAYKMYSKQETADGDMGELRQELQRGLEVVRCISGHGLHPWILSHLARMFHTRAQDLKAADNSNPDIGFYEARVEMYWEAAVPLLERVLNNLPIKNVSNKLFELKSKEMSNLEIVEAFEEGRLILAQKLLRNKYHEQAIEMLQSLKCAEASFLQGEIYKQLADDLLNDSSANFPSARSRHVAILNKAKSSYYLTLDRLRSPKTDPNHPLNANLGDKIAAVEEELQEFCVDANVSDRKNDGYEMLSDASYSSAQSIPDTTPNYLSVSHGNSMITPQKSVRRTPKKSSTPRVHHSGFLNRIQQESRPSPERLDAQMRQFIHSQEKVMQSMMDQQKAQQGTNTQLFQAVDTLCKEISELRVALQKNRTQTAQPEEDMGYVYEEDYTDMNFTMPVQPQAPVIPPMARGMFAATPPRQPFPNSPMLYPAQPPLPAYYPDPLAFPAAHAAHAAQTLASFHRPGFLNNQLPMMARADQAFANIPQYPQGVFDSRLMSQLTDMVSPHLPQMAMDLNRMEPITPVTPVMPPTVKDAPIIKAPPMNVVITTSDTLPTSAPTVQPVLSVTIPPRHRNVGAATTTSGDFPHNYQISMPSQATIPTTVNLPPLATTITTTMAATNERNNVKNTSIVSVGSHNSSIEAVEVEHDPIPHFVPVIPLPDEVAVTTGEEDEETLFCARAKLFRFVNKEWKERGIGNVKLLKNNEGKIRLLMRRDQVLKICANHLLTSDMTLSAMPNSDKAWIWVANDYADEEVRLETFCIRFKLVEEALSFQDAFVQAQAMIVESPEKEKPQKVDKPQEKVEKPHEKPKEKPSKPAKAEVSAATLATKADQNEGKTDEPVKPNPFAGFSFTAAASKSAPAKPLSELFKPAEGSWECSGCYTRNTASASICIACSTPQKAPAATKPAVQPALNSNCSVSQASLSELFKPPSDSWECKHCYIRNTNANSYCVACDSPSDPSLPPKPSSGGFGIKPSTAGAPSTFTFGIPTSTSPKDFTFGIPKPADTPPASTFKFGSPGKSFNFQFSSSKSPVKSPGAGNVSEDEVVESEDVYFEPVVPLPDKIDVKTGEEDEQVLYTHRAKLFRYDSNSKEWKERGLGDIKLLLHEKTKKLRLVMRREQTLKLCLNHSVLPDLEITPKDEKTWMWNAADFSDGEIEYVGLACRFKTAEIAEEFKKAVESATKTLEGDEMAELVQSLNDESTKELQVLYETSVSQDEKDAARKLQLPENFYSYKQKEDCPGCIGCKEPAVPIFEDKLPKIAIPTIESPTTPIRSIIQPPKFTSPSATTATITPIPSAFGNKDKSLNVGDSSGNQWLNKTNEDKSANSNSSFVFGTSVSQDNSILNKGFCTTDIKSSFNFGNSSAVSNNQVNFGTSPAAQTTHIFGAPSTTSIFGGSAIKNLTAVSSAPGFGRTPANSLSTNAMSPVTPSWPSFSSASKEPPISFSNANPIGLTSSASADSQQPDGTSPVISGTMFGLTPLLAETKAESTPIEKDAPSFLTKVDNITDFSALAAEGAKPVGFKTDPNFTFAGAGTSVFGAKNPALSAKNLSKDNVEENEEGEAEAEDDTQEYDPHYEPIVPLPEMIEVRTGEEDEQRLYSQRAKLFRFEADTKEWKERGVGEMRLLYHPHNATYRLLLRREQVHKVVCNFLLTPDLDMQKLSTSESAWVWAGMNYVEDNSVCEKLAVKFKTPALAAEFKAAVDQAMQELRDRKVVCEPDVDNHYEGYQVEEVDDENDGEEDEDDDETNQLMFEKLATMEYFDNQWHMLGEGVMKMFYDSNVYGIRIVLVELDDYLSNTLINMDSVLTVDGNKCSWTAIEEACDPPVERTLRACFPTEVDAEEMREFFNEGVECARQCGH